MCLGLCLSKQSYRVLHCIPLWTFVLLIYLLVLAENVLFLLNPIFILPSGILTVTFPLYVCSSRRVSLRHCVWITYMIVSILQLFVALVVFAITVYYPEEEECTQTVDEYGKASYDCKQIKSEVDASLVSLQLGLMIYYMVKSSVLVIFLYAFAQKVNVDERKRFDEVEEEKRLEELKERAKQKALKAEKRRQQEEEEEAEERLAEQDKNLMGVVEVENSSVKVVKYPASRNMKKRITPDANNIGETADDSMDQTQLPAIKMNMGMSNLRLDMPTRQFDITTIQNRQQQQSRTSSRGNIINPSTGGTRWKNNLSPNVQQMGQTSRLAPTQKLNYDQKAAMRDSRQSARDAPVQASSGGFLNPAKNLGSPQQSSRQSSRSSRRRAQKKQDEQNPPGQIELNSKKPQDNLEISSEDYF